MTKLHCAIGSRPFETTMQSLSGIDYTVTRRHNPKERRAHLNRCGKLKT